MLSKKMAVLFCIMLLAFFFGLLAIKPGSAGEQTAAPAQNPPQTEEDKLGAKAAEELEKAVKTVKEPPELPKLMEIVNEIAPQTERPEVKYTVKVMQSKAINAVSLPGGRLYITQGAIDAAESDDELAAILAHEIAHNALKHALKQQKRASRADLGVLAGILAGIASGRGEVALMAMQIQEGELNHYGRKAEAEADSHALNYLTHTRYRPIAMLTVLEGLAAIEAGRLQPQITTTADTHPLAKDRAHDIEKALVAKGVDIAAERRAVTNRFKIETKPVEKDGRTIAEILLNGKPVFTPVQTDGTSPPLARAQVYADSLKKALRQGIQLMDLKLSEEGKNMLVTARGMTLVKVLPGDAQFHKQSSQALAAEAKKAIEIALYAERISRPF